MKMIKNERVVNYLYKRNIFPRKETANASYYVECEKLNKALEDYYIEAECFRNWQPRYFK